MDANVVAVDGRIWRAISAAMMGCRIYPLDAVRWPAFTVVTMQ